MDIESITRELHERLRKPDVGPLRATKDEMKIAWLISEHDRLTAALAAANEEAKWLREALVGKREYRHLAIAAIDTCESVLSASIWPADHNDMSELLDECEESMRAAEAVRS